MTEFCLNVDKYRERVKANLFAFIEKLPADKPWRVKIELLRKQRTLPQNALYWEWLTAIGNEIGYTKDEMHDTFREKFLPWREVEVCGVRRKILTSTSSPEFTTAMMAEYMSHIDRFAAQELGIVLPTPSDFLNEVPKGEEGYA